ncbi:hypothetical protein ATZ36_10550 [Candidatus Endomicrobiellum trichonymphae]|uniref:DUF177 domain-containing protein n=1 Tax=Endomicrobium trichonymphae TaxID=1408204 RepID=A0A1E5IFT7_ENDTX|nr:hypothetical protein ATZ36_10550 [Candidatus Endomicrobium trichonymphae]
MNKLILSLSDFLKTDTVEIKTYDYKGDIGCKSDISVSFKAVKISDDKIYISGKIKGSLYLECSCCLSVYKHPVEIAIDACMDILNGQINAGEEVRQLMLIEMPMKPLCSRDCRVFKICSEHNKKDDFYYCDDDANAGLIRERLKELLNKNVRRK